MSAFLTAGLPGVGGVAKVAPEDFEVEEIPAYEPSGSGEHLYLWVEKRARETREVAKAVARLLGVSEREVSWAGLKDRQAVSRQWLSVRTPQTPAAVEGDGFRALAISRHGNKLRPGHLKGNRFVIVLRGATDVAAARAVLEVLVRRGAPNWFGAQRFGRGGDNAALGLALLGQGAHPGLERAKRDRFLRKLALSALQADLFNRVLAARLDASALDRAEQGDLLQKGDDGRGPLFLCERPEEDAPRVAAFEVSPTGPMFGPRMRQPGGEPARREAAVLVDAGIALALFERGGDETAGTRRPVRVRPWDAEATPVPEGLRIAFSLPSGAYATTVLREITKAEP
ncbi:MAG TPA: tRNA pseudouridine(13) synthase TruD [Myxococcales bacterium]|nr:tRNA pseudouridine(13) synthase TruD [Myxococcales bacterium]